MKNSQTPFPADLTATMEGAGKTMIACDLDGTVRVFNQAAERLLGWSASEVVGQQTPELWHDPEEIAQRAAELAEELGRDVSADFQVFAVEAAGHCDELREWTCHRKDGTSFPGQLVTSTICDASGRITGYLGIVQDISQRVQAEQERDRIFNLSQDILCVSSNDGYFKRVNPAFSRILGWSEAELLGRPYLDFVHPDERHATQQEVDKQMASGPVPAFENRYLCKNGSWRTLSWTSTPQPDGWMFATARDVTELRRAEAKMRKSERDLSLTLRSIGDGVIATDTKRRVTRLNSVAEQLTGWREHEAVGRPIDEVFVITNEVTGQPGVIPVDEVLATGAVKGLANHTLLVSRDGSEYPITENAAPIRNNAGRITGVVLVFRDASIERDFEKKLQQVNNDLERRVAERTKALVKEQQRLRHGHLVLESVASDAALSDTLDLIARFVHEEVPTIHCGILVYDAVCDGLQHGSLRDLPDDFEKTLQQPQPGKRDRWIWQAFQSGERVVVEDLTSDEPDAEPHRTVSNRECRSGWAEPIVTEEGWVQGVIVAFRKQGGSPDEHETTCVKCASGLAQIAIARHQARAALKASEARYRTLLERIPAPTFVYDRESLAYLAVSDQAVAEYGYSREEFMQMTIADIRPEEDVPALRKMLGTSGSDFEHRGVWRHRKKDGTLIDVKIETHGLELQGRSACIVLATDVTEKFRTENALHRSEALTKAILQSSLDCIVTMNEAGEIVEFNHAAEQAFDCARDQALGRSVKELMIPEHLREDHERGMAHYLATGEDNIFCKRIQTTALRADGETFPIELTVVPLQVDGERLFTAFLRDMTQAVRSEAELRRSNELLQAIADGTSDAVFVKDLQGEYLLFNRAATDLTGRSTEEVLGKNNIFLFGEEEGRKVMENDRSVMQSNQSRTVEEELTAAGVTRSYLAVKAPLRDSNGNVAGMIGVSRDITERKQMETTLRESEERYRSIFDQSPDMIFISQDDRVLFVNQAGVDLLGASSAEEIIGRSPLDFFHPDDHPQIRRRIAQLLSGPRIVPILEKRIVALDGSVIDADVQSASYDTDGKLEIQVVCRDVTARKRVDRELQRHARHAEFNADVGLALSRMPTLPEMLQGCAEAMVTHFYADLGRIWTLNESDGTLELQASAGTDPGLDKMHRRTAVGRHEIGKIAEKKTPFLTNSAREALDFCDLDQPRDQGFASFAGYPLLSEDRCVGVIAMYANQAFEPDTLECLALAANGIAQNIERKQSEVMLADLNKTLEQRITDRTLALQQSEQFNQATLDALSAHIAVVDPEGVIVATNTGWRKFAEENEGACLLVNEGANYLDVCDAAAKRGETDAGIVAMGIREVLAGERPVWQHEYACHSPTERRWFICLVTLCYVGQEPHAVLAHENVTSIKLAQEELREAKEKADRASLAKSDFLATMSHELRTPLNGILGMNTLLLRTELNDRQRRFAEACISSGKLLNQLVNDVLDLSKIEAGKLELDPRPCEIEAVVYDVVDIFSNAAQEKGLTLSCRLSQSACVTARTDDNRLRQILVNIIGNAIKFTSSGGVSIIGERIEKEPGQSRLRIEITDTGIGIPQDRADRLFKPFSQVDSSTTREFGGTGLGLSICAQLVALMDGKIGAEGQVGTGSTFWFEIPLEVISKHTKQARKRHALAAAECVIVDSSGEEQVQIAEWLTSWGCRCEQVETLRESLDALQRLEAKQTVPVVVLNSLHAIQSDSTELQQVVERCAGRVVAVSTAEVEASVEQLRSLGVRSILAEPVRPSELFDAMSEFLLHPSPDEEAETEPTEMSSAEPSPGKLTGHLLVAEDNQINKLYVVELLRMMGCTCDVAANGKEALSALKEKRYDLILMDCQMPEMDGFTASREIRRREREANENPPTHIPIVALTANALKGDRDRCLDAGMDDYLVKPIDGDQLREALEEFLSPSQSSQKVPGEAR